MRSSIIKYISLGLLGLFFACGPKQDKQKPDLEKEIQALMPALQQADSLGKQVFTFEYKGEKIIEGKSGTLIHLPEGALLNDRNEPVSGEINVELKEALSAADMILNGLSTTSDGKLLSTGGMIHLAFSADNEPLHINPEKPLFIEIPAREKIPGMMVYKGVVGADGHLNWINPKPLEKYLVRVDRKELDFLPPGFEQTVEENMPYRNYNKATPRLVDSLYYSLSVWKPVNAVAQQPATEINEPYQQRGNSNIENGNTAKRLIV